LAGLADHEALILVELNPLVWGGTYGDSIAFAVAYERIIAAVSPHASDFSHQPLSDFDGGFRPSRAFGTSTIPVLRESRPKGSDRLESTNRHTLLLTK